MATYSALLKWDSLQGASVGQRIEYKPKTQSGWISFQEVGKTVNQIVIPNLSAHIDYDFRVVNICSATSETPSTTVDFQKLTCPLFTHTTTNSSIQVKLTVADNPSSINYRVQLIYNGTVVATKDAMSGANAPASLVYNFPDLQADTAYQYQISFTRNGDTKVCPAQGVSTLGNQCPTFENTATSASNQLKFKVSNAQGLAIQQYKVDLRKETGDFVATATQTPNAGDTELTFTFDGLTTIMYYEAELTLVLNSVSRTCSKASGRPSAAAPVDEVCNFSEAFSGTWGIQNKEFTVSFTGTIYYMFDAAGIPDKLIVYKNDQTFNNHIAYSNRVKGAIPVKPGDKIKFTVDARVTADRATGWMLKANCSQDYDLNMVVEGWEISIADNNPFINYITAECTGTSRSFTVHASPAVNTQAPVTYYKAVKADLIAANGTITSYGQSFINTVTVNGQVQNHSSWQTSPVITKDQSGASIQKNYPYVVYIKDSYGNTAATGRTFAIAEVMNTLDCN